MRNSRTIEMVYHPALLPTMQGKDGNTTTTRYRQSLRYTQDYFTVNTSYLQVDKLCYSRTSHSLQIYYRVISVDAYLHPVLDFSQGYSIGRDTLPWDIHM